MPSENATLRQVMYQPSACWLSTDASGHRWLTDMYVLLDVTHAESLKSLEDGPYKMTVSNGPQSRETPEVFNAEAYLSGLADRLWRPASPTEWSVAEHPGKAMLWASEGSVCLIGESTWTAVQRHYPGAVVEYTHRGNLFRFSEVAHLDLDGDCQSGECSCGIVAFAYAAGIQVPEGQEGVADSIVSALVTTSIEEAA